MPLRLIIEDDEGATTIVPLGKEAITIGRQQGNTIQLTEKNVSRNHARLFPDAEAWMIEDLNSYNGIKVNDKPVDGRTKLREGDIVQIGDYHLAITEDVDKRTLNYDRHGQAANDGTDPLLASSSADLPRLSPEEIHALSSGPQQITPPPSPMMVDSGPVPATPYAHAYGEPRKKGAGLLIVVGLFVLAASAVAAFVLLQPGDEGATTTAGKAEKTDTPPTKKPPTTPSKPPPDPAGAEDGAPTPAIEDGGDDAVEAVDPVPEPATPDPVPTPPPDVTPDPVPTPPPTTSPKNDPTKKKKKQPQTKTNNTPPPPPPANTGPSAEDLLAQARTANLKGPYGEAYRLAKESYKKKKSADAARIMAMAGCKLGDKSKAKSGFTKLSAATKEQIRPICAANGIEL